MLPREYETGSVRPSSETRPNGRSPENEALEVWRDQRALPGGWSQRHFPHILFSLFRHFPCGRKRFMVPHDCAGSAIDLQLISRAWRDATAFGGRFDAVYFNPGGSPDLGFCDVMLTGLARDGGLYVPEVWPQLKPETIAGFFGRPYWEVAVDVLKPFVGEEISDADLGRMANEAYATFRHPAVVPLDQTGPNHFVLELFHGPTLAFKDVAMQLISRLMDHVLAKRAQRTTIVVATSGDTGGAAVDAFAGLDNVDLVVLFPHGRISDVQRRMMTTTGAANVHALAIEGTFDDCQAIVKALFNHHASATRFRCRASTRSTGRGSSRKWSTTSPRPSRWGACARGRFHRADRKFWRHFWRICGQAHGAAGALPADRRQHQRYSAAHPEDRHL